MIYLFDAQFEPYFTMVSSMVDYYGQTGFGTPVIVVGIHTEDRWSEFAPIPANEQHGQSEGSNKLHNSLAQEVFPFIDSTYRTTNFRIGVGHSLGGTFVVDEALQEPSLFPAIIAASPNLTFENDHILSVARQFFAQHPDARRFISIRGGTQGSPENLFTPTEERLDSLIKQLAPARTAWDFAVLRGKNHMATFVPAFDEGYLALSSLITLNDEQLLSFAADSTKDVMSQIRAFARNASELTGTKSEITASLLDNYGYTLFQYDKYTAARSIYEQALQLLGKDTLVESNNKLRQTIDEGIKRCTMYALSDQAEALAKGHRYKEAAELYKQAFAIDLIRVTHPIRIKAVPIFAKAGETDRAFEQLDLLAHRFKLAGNEDFINDPLCAPLHEDKRWKTLMTDLENNWALYR